MPSFYCRCYGTAQLAPSLSGLDHLHLRYHDSRSSVLNFCLPTYVHTWYNVCTIWKRLLVTLECDVGRQIANLRPLSTQTKHLAATFQSCPSIYHTMFPVIVLIVGWLTPCLPYIRAVISRLVQRLETSDELRVKVWLTFAYEKHAE